MSWPPARKSFWKDLEVSAQRLLSSDTAPQQLRRMIQNAPRTEKIRNGHRRVSTLPLLAIRFRLKKPKLQQMQQQNCWPMPQQIEPRLKLTWLRPQP